MKYAKGMEKFARIEPMPKKTCVKLLMLLQECETLELHSEPTYQSDPTATWIYCYVRILNVSWRKDNPIKIILRKGSGE